MSEDARKSLRDYTRAAGGGLMIGLPLLYTMEVWFSGFILPWWKIIVLLGIAYAIVFGYNTISGFRQERSVQQLVIDSVSTIGLGVTIAFIALLVLGRIDAGTSLRDAAGKVGLEAIPIAFGASLAATQLSGKDIQHRQRIGPLARLLVGAGGALLLALNVAPTEEIVLLGLDASPILLLAIMATSLVVTFVLVFYADFGGQKHRAGDGLLDHPWSETITSYAVSLAVALLLLWSFGRTDGASVPAIAGMTVVLALVAAFGAAIARLLVGGQKEGGAEDE